MTPDSKTLFQRAVRNKLESFKTAMIARDTPAEIAEQTMQLWQERCGSTAQVLS